MNTSVLESFCLVGIQRNSTSHDFLDQIFHQNTPTKFSQPPDGRGLRIPHFLQTPQVFWSIGRTSRERRTGADGPLRQLSAAAVAPARNAALPRIAAAATRPPRRRRPERRRARETLFFSVRVRV